jgi:hypothetical protein
MKVIEKILTNKNFNNKKYLEATYTNIVSQNCDKNMKVIEKILIIKSI